MLQILIQGMLLSGLYALIAVGFTLIFSIGRTLNLAYGAYLMLGGYIYFWASQGLEFPKLIAVAVAVLFGILIGVLKFRLIVKPLKANHIAIEISTLILAVVLQAGVILVFGDSSKILLPKIGGVVYVAGAPVTYNMLIATVASWAIYSLFMFLSGEQILAEPCKQYLWTRKVRPSAALNQTESTSSPGRFQVVLARLVECFLQAIRSFPPLCGSAR